ncbi:MAG: VPLPA-CTERM sorting domain-containing protein [Gammaproteobacteria bacterium]|nr:VPLPA-CTERM sorting domain-containing protein [Gammaproteobacteria bacterium]
MRVEFNFSGLTGNTTASHIHCCTLVAGSGNAGVAPVVPTFAFPLGVQAGVFDRTFDLSLASSFNAAFVTANGGTPTSATNALVLGLDAMKAYLNIHTSAAAAGEIRTLLAPVPLPAAVWLMLPALAGLVGMRKSRT